MAPFRSALLPHAHLPSSFSVPLIRLHGSGASDARPRRPYDIRRRIPPPPRPPHLSLRHGAPSLLSSRHPPLPPLDDASGVRGRPAPSAARPTRRRMAARGWRRRWGREGGGGAVCTFPLHLTLSPPPPPTAHALTAAAGPAAALRPPPLWPPPPPLSLLIAAASVDRRRAQCRDGARLRLAATTAVAAAALLVAAHRQQRGCGHERVNHPRQRGRRGAALAVAEPRARVPGADAGAPAPIVLATSPADHADDAAREQRAGRLGSRSSRRHRHCRRRRGRHCPTRRH